MPPIVFWCIIVRVDYVTPSSAQAGNAHSMNEGNSHVFRETHINHCLHFQPGRKHAFSLLLLKCCTSFLFFWLAVFSWRLYIIRSAWVCVFGLLTYKRIQKPPWRLVSPLRKGVVRFQEVAAHVLPGLVSERLFVFEAFSYFCLMFCRLTGAAVGACLSNTKEGLRLEQHST